MVVTIRQFETCTPPKIDNLLGTFPSFATCEECARVPYGDIPTSAPPQPTEAVVVFPNVPGDPTGVGTTSL